MAPRLILFVALFLGILYGNALFAEDTLVTAQGTGRSYRAAVNEALIAALEQQTGFQLSSSQRSQLTASDDAVSLTGDAESEENRQELHDAIQMESKKWSEGRIQGYQVTDS